MITILFILLVVVIVYRQLTHRPPKNKMTKPERRNFRRELLQDMPIREFNQALKKAYEKHKGDPEAFVREVPFVCDDYDSFDMEKMCGFIDGTHDIKKSMFASYLVKVQRGK